MLKTFYKIMTEQKWDESLGAKIVLDFIKENNLTSELNQYMSEDILVQDFFGDSIPKNFEASMYWDLAGGVFGDAYDFIAEKNLQEELITYTCKKFSIT